MTDDFERRLDNGIRAVSWPAIRAVFEAWPAGRARDDALARAHHALAGWRDRDLEIPIGTWRAIQEGEDPPVWWSLARHLRLETDDTLDGIDCARQLRSLELIRLDAPANDATVLADLRALCISGPLDDPALLTAFPHLELLALHAQAVLPSGGAWLPSTLLDLEITSTPMTDTSALSPLARLRRLTLIDNRKLRDLGGLKALHELKQLAVARSAVETLAPLTGLHQLSMLELVELDALDDLAPLSNLVNLTDLTLGGPNLAELSPLSTLRQLVYLSITNAGLTDLAPIAALPRLERLILSSLPSLQSLDSITHLPALSELVLANLPLVKDVTPLASLPRLEVLAVEQTGITDFTPLDPRPLRRLTVDGKPRR
jgi:hypothetical protein